ncbi:sigma-54 dependent transcriptional regulator [Motilimonas pumila]|uniref:Sigma-54-dependent Fis family transcriptional regulator n=1 Tax=Motilimonas pumila TaxID=2303987 RepID=A0A418YH33_9GAMM|nr:sigma-54 dependent transcriptional regulator [Motilimonas pumila]RJG49019.1 sigma-54-dependent Fis family transcriptional regulator [Motilimonas pumila]
MAAPLSVLIIDSNRENLSMLSTILSFIGEECEFLDDLTAAAIPTRHKGVIFGEIAPSLAQDFAIKNPKLPFIGACESLDISSVNYLGQLSQPFSYDDLTRLLHHCQSYLGKIGQLKDQSQHSYLLKMLVGKGDAISEVRHMIEQVAGTAASVLILGESGTGKEVVARAVHDISERKKGPFVPVNCGAIPPDLLESELFGHEKGAFTGAFAARKGRFELAEGGTLFLDEIGDMPMPMQVKLLRVLQERTFERVGGSKSIQADVRVIAATHQRLEAMIAEGKFREDLFYRLNVFPIETPALRQRQDDIPLLLQELLSRHEVMHNASVRFTQRSIESLMLHAWPGNVRELSNLVERLLILHPNKIVDVNELPAKYRHLETEDVEMELPSAIAEREALLGIFNDDFVFDDEQAIEDDSTNALTDAPMMANALPEDGVNLKDMLAEFEVDMIRQALDQQAGVVARAAEQLGMRRTTLVEKMKKYGLSSKE